jgi:rfaE bifunctional protein kinase chain/domain
MNLKRFRELTRRYPNLSVAVIGDFCLDRYLEIDPRLEEVSIETGLPVHNVTKVRSQPGAAGTVLNNLVALGAGTIYPIGFCGEDGEGFELRSALGKLAGVQGEHFISSPQVRTFTYTKPLVIQTGKPPRELNRLDMKNHLPTPRGLRQRMCRALTDLEDAVDAIIVLDQVTAPETGVVTREVLSLLGKLARRPGTLIIGDSRKGLRHFPPMIFKMNASELAAYLGQTSGIKAHEEALAARKIAQKTRHPVFVTRAERGMMSVAPNGAVAEVLALPLRGQIDIVGAGDSVTANLAMALAAGGSAQEGITLANAAASIVIHQLGTTGTASVRQIAPLLKN